MTSYVGALHNPQRVPRGLAIAVGGPPAVAGQYRSALASFGGHHLAHSVVVLLVYALLGVALMVAAGARRYSDEDRDLSLGIGSSAAGVG